MKIIQLTPGSGDFYCENCLRDHALVTAMRRQGHDALMLPLYLPIRTDVPVEAPRRIFFGGINVYLQQRWGLFRRLPRWMDSLLNARGLLRRISGNSTMVEARELGEMTLSMLRGEEGRQVKELHRLCDSLGAGQRPDVVCLSNALLLGLARTIRHRIGCPVICLLQDEDFWLNALDEPQRSQCWREMVARAGDVDLFIAPSQYFAAIMTQRLGLAPDRVHMVYSGIDLAGLAVDEEDEGHRGGDDGTVAPASQSPVIGYLSRSCREKGLDLLIEAVAVLRSDPRMADVRLRVTGGELAQDGPFLREVRSRVAQLGLAGVVEFLPNPDRAGKRAFLRSLSALCVPTRDPEAFGLFVLESLACGVPVVLPRHGSFVELMERLRGGVLHEPRDVGAIAKALLELLANPGRAKQLGQAGQAAVLRDFGVDRSAAQMLEAYRSLVASRGQS